MILIVPDKFKGSLTASQVADCIENAIRTSHIGGQSLEIVKLPMADGGDGSLEVVEKALGKEAERVSIDTVDSLMRPLKTDILLYDNGKSAFLEMAKICGLAQLSKEERNPEKTTTYGMGLVLSKIVGMKCSKVVIGIGGSSTNDGGEGMMRAFPKEFWDKLNIEVACDVRNPLLGPNGATMVYGPQKGADSEMLERLEKRMEEFALEAGLDTAVEGGGAAGGVGAALHKMGGKLLPGWQVFGRMVGLEEKIAAADAVITAEGRFDSQSLCGKLPDGINTLCKKYKKKPIVVCGQCSLKREVWKKAGIGDVYALRDIEPDLSKCFANTVQMLGADDVLVVGCDEAGRGPLAGPVYAAAVILPKDFNHPYLNDSKQLNEARREQLRPIIEKEALAWGVASVSAQEIDKINILNASIKAMHLAIDECLAKLGTTADHKVVIADGNRFKPYKNVSSHTVVKGDGKIKAVAAASILAKTHRDEFMREIAKEYPEYGWERNMAYPTKDHRDAIRRLGPTKYHRLTFNLLEGKENNLFIFES